MKRNKSYFFASLLALGAAMPAFAQSQPSTQPQPSDNDRDVVVITANKREETVQDVAVAVTAITSEAKEQLGIISVTDLTNVTPGLSYTPGNERVTLRGIGRLTNSFGADPGVANYNDGIYTAFAVFAGKDPFLIDRVEVLRGPQGTLYGRNAIGGAINTISKRPTDNFEVDAVFGIGDYDARKVGVSVSGPITDDIRYRAVGFRESRDGIDPNHGENGAMVGWEIDDEYLELQLEGDVGDNFSWWLKVADLYYDKAGPPGGRTATFSTAPYLTNVPSQQFFVTGALGPNPAFGFTPNPSVLSVTQGGSRRDAPFATNREHAYNTNIENTARLPQYDEAILEAVYSTDGFDIKYVGGYQFYAYELDSDPDGTPITSVTYQAMTSRLPISACAAVPVGAPASIAGACATGTAARTLRPNVTNTYKESRSFFSNEINLISTTEDPLQWIVGAYQYQENSKQPGQTQFLKDEPLANFYIDTSLGVVQNPDRVLQWFSNTSLFNAYGLYGQADYTFNDQWKATVGLRWSKDMKDSREEAFLACYIICGGATALDYLNYTRIQYGTVPGISFDGRGYGVRELTGSYEATTGTAGLEYRPFDDTLLFGKYSRGYKAGGFNNLGMAALPYTNPEYVDAYEGGWKQEWADMGLTTNAAVFYYKYTDAQAPLGVVLINPTTGVQTASTQFVNLPEVETTGFELEGNWNPIDPLNIGFTYAYLKAEITDGGGIYTNSARDQRCISPATGNPLVSCATLTAPANTNFVDPASRTRLEGHSLAQSPEHKYAINATYRFDFEDGSWLLPTVSYSWRDEFYDSFFNEPGEKSPAYANLDARLNWYSADGVFSITGWVRNALDEEQTTSISTSGYRIADAGRYQVYSFAPPRTVGVDFKIHFE